MTKTFDEMVVALTEKLGMFAPVMRYNPQPYVSTLTRKQRVKRKRKNKIAALQRKRNRK